MPRVYKRKARQDIWEVGFRTPANNKQGFSVDRSIPASTGDNEALDRLLVKKGEEYYTWHSKGYPWQYSTQYPTFPKSEWEEKWEEFQNQKEEIEYSSDDDEKESNRYDLRTAVEEYRDELQSRLDNIPESLQESSVLTERIQSLEDLIDELA